MQSGHLANAKAGMKFIRKGLIFTLMFPLFSGRPVSGTTQDARLRQEKPKVLLIAQSPTLESLAEFWRDAVPAEVTFAAIQMAEWDGQHHLCDKPLEETAEDVALMKSEADRYLWEQIERLSNFSVVFAQVPVRTSGNDETGRLTNLQAHLARYAAEGGSLVVINPGWEANYDDTPLVGVMPTRAGQMRCWTYGPGRATDHPLTCGLPMETIGTHFYGPAYEPVNSSCEALTHNESGASYWYRRLPGGGQVVHLYQAGGARWQWQSGTTYETYEGDRADEGLAWNEFCRRLILWLSKGDSACPVVLRLDSETKAAAQTDRRLAISAVLSNRLDEACRVGIRFSATDRRGSEAQSAERHVVLAPRTSERVAVALPLNLPAWDRQVLVEAVARREDGGGDEIRSFVWMPVPAPMSIEISTDKQCYRPGETVHVTIRSTAEGTPTEAHGRLFMVDRQGRALSMSDFPLGVAGNTAAEASLIMPERGPECAGAYWVTAVVEEKGRLRGLARRQVQLDCPWDMRTRMEWSVWTAGGGGRFIELLLDAGFNALGCQGNSYTTDRYGMRQYVEGTGINTFSVTIDQAGWEDVRAAMEKTIESLNRQGPDARSKSLVSLGEESGFQGGWGARYYWPEERAPAIPQKVFQNYLSERYGGDIAKLNAEWGTTFSSFDQIPLEKDKARFPAQVFVGAQMWEALAEKNEQKGRLPVDLRTADPGQRCLAYSAPYYETYRFFDWYYQKYCDLATAIYRERRNPVPLTIMSAPGGFYPKVDVYNFNGLGPFYPKEYGLAENAVARMRYGDVPGFSGAMWAYFDLESLWRGTVISTLLAGNTHVDYWVDVPLTINADLTHTRASFWTKTLRHQIHPLEPLLLHKRAATTPGLGLFVGEQPLPKGLTGEHFGSAIGPNAPVYAALEESGFLPRVVGHETFSNLSVVVASYAQVASREEGRALAAFVHNGGTLLTTPWLASATEHGNLLSVYPSEESGLAELLGFRLLHTSQKLIKESATVRLERLGGSGTVTLKGHGRDRVLDRMQDVEVLGAYDDETPCVLARSVGKGRVIYLNMVFDWNDWWNSFYAPEREAYRKVFDAALRSAGLQPSFFLAFESAEPVEDNKGWWMAPLKGLPARGESVPWWASQLYTDPSGRLAYLAIISDHRSPWIQARLIWPQAGMRFTELLTARDLPRDDDHVPLVSLRPGEGALVAITPENIRRLDVDAPRRVPAGQPIPLRICAVGADQNAEYALVVDVTDPEGQPSSAHSLANVRAPGGRCSVSIPTALNDQPGIYTVRVTEAISRKTAHDRVHLITTAEIPDRTRLTPFPARPSEIWPPSSTTGEELLANLRGLRSVYEGNWAGLEAKWRLSYFLNVPYRPQSRHAYVRRLQRANWSRCRNMIEAAMSAGEWFYLLGEDLNRDPRTGMRIDPFAGDMESVIRSWSDGAARPVQSGEEGFKLQIVRIGKGGLILGPSCSVDRAAYHSSDFQAWHERLKRALAAARMQ